MLNQSRLEYGYTGSQITGFSLHSLLDETAQSFSWQAAQAQTPISVQISSTFVDGFEGDASKIKTIIANFISNAIKYAPGSPIEIRAESYPDELGTVDVHIEICDRGPGILPEEQKLIFKKFVRGSSAKEKRLPGTGLGLATCHSLALSLSGSVGVDSAIGHGSVFYLRLPLRRKELPVTNSPIHIKKTNGAALIVEDEHYNQVVLKGIALELGYVPVLAGNAEQANTVLKNQTFDLIFLDWELPGLKGGEIARLVRSQSGGERPIIISVTAHDSYVIRRQCYEAGMDEFLRKPYDAEQVRQCLARVLVFRGGDSGREEIGKSFPQQPSKDINLKAIQLYGRGEPSEAAHAMHLYCEALDDELVKLQQAVQLANDQSMAQCAHRIHALGGLLGATDLNAAAKALELLSPDAPPAERKKLYDSIVAATAGLKDQIREAMLASDRAG